MVSSIARIGPQRSLSSNASISAWQALAAAIIQSDIVRRDNSTPRRANCRACRYSGNASQNFAVAMNASSPSEASPFGISAAGGGAIRTAGCSSSPEPSQ